MMRHSLALITRPDPVTMLMFTLRTSENNVGHSDRLVQLNSKSIEDGVIITLSGPLVTYALLYLSLLRVPHLERTFPIDMIVCRQEDEE